MENCLAPARSSVSFIAPNDRSFGDVFRLEEWFDCRDWVRGLLVEH